MELGLVLNTHGVGNRDDFDWWHTAMPASEMRPVEAAQLAERLGFHSVWMGDHVAMPETSPDSVSPVHVEGASNPEWRSREAVALDNMSEEERALAEVNVGGSRRHYPLRPNILDGVAVMGGIAAATSRIKFGPSVLISAYRHPLNDARQFMSLDYLSGGRLILGAGAGWMKEEFDALGQPHEHRLAMLEECLQIYHLCWTQPRITFHGRFYHFDNLTMDPKPLQNPRPPIVVGATTRAGARLVARYADALFPIFVRPFADPHDYDTLQSEIRRECDKIGRNPAEIGMMVIASARISDAADPEATRAPRRNLGGAADQILSDLQRFADAGYSLIVMAPACPTRRFAEYQDQVERLAAEVLPQAKKIKAAHGWKPF